MVPAMGCGLVVHPFISLCPSHLAWFNCSAINPFRSFPVYHDYLSPSSVNWPHLFPCVYSAPLHMGWPHLIPCWVLFIYSTIHGLTSSTSLLSVVSCSAIHGLSLPPSMLSVAYLLHYTWADLISLPDECTWNAWFCEYDTFRLRMYVFLWQGISDRLCYRTCKTYIDTTVEQLHHPISNKLKLTDVKY